MIKMWVTSREVLLLALLFVIGGVPAAGQAQPDEEKCVVLCRPELKIEPTFTVENTFGRRRLATLDEDGNIIPGSEMRATRDRVFELIAAVDIPTQIPRVGSTVEVIFAPFVDATPEVELELNLTWLRSEKTKGWVGSHFDIVDKISPSDRPGDAGAYTHKLNFELDTAVSIFNWLPEGNWLRNIELEASLDYVATGLPRAGDRIGNLILLDDASGWSFSLVVVIPLAPLRPRHR